MDTTSRIYRIITNNLRSEKALRVAEESNPAGLGMRICRMLRSFRRKASEWSTRPYLFQLKRKAQSQKPGTLIRFSNCTVRINDGPNFYTLYKDIFINRIYHFEAERPDPLILDCGSNIGMTIMYFKHVYPQGRVIGFEPDPTIFPYLQENIHRNDLSEVKLVQAAVAGRDGPLKFYSDGKYASCLSSNIPAELANGWSECNVPSVRLGDYLSDRVDFLKMNIEGAEFEVLADIEKRLRQIREMIIEYHHLPSLPRTLHKILGILNRQGFDYLINDFDSETNGEVRAPFRLTPESRYFLLIYGKRID